MEKKYMDPVLQPEERAKALLEEMSLEEKVQEIVMENSEHHIPAIFHMEGLCGAFIQDSTSFPSGIGRGASFDPELEEKIAKIVSRQEAACGIPSVFYKDGPAGAECEEQEVDIWLAPAVNLQMIESTGLVVCD